jgi:hypothetical protein
VFPQLGGYTLQLFTDRCWLGAHQIFEVGDALVMSFLLTEQVRPAVPPSPPIVPFTSGFSFAGSLIDHSGQDAADTPSQGQATGERDTPPPAGQVRAPRPPYAEHLEKEPADG